MSERLAFVTGGTGFVGAAVIRALCAEGTRVRALVRPGSDRSNLAELDVELVEGDLSSREALLAGMTGCDEVHHCAALYAFWSADPAEFIESNVEGTRRIIQEAVEAKVSRFVHCSSVATVAPIRGKAATEDSQADPDKAPGPYKRSKILSEHEALRLAGEGAPVVVVNPAAPVGPGDIKPTPTGQMVLDFLEGRMPAFVDTSLNVVDVDDVARGHLLAARKGRVGERYILGGENLTLEEILGLLAEASGRKAPTLCLPHWVPEMVARFSEAWAKVSGRPPRVALESARLARHHMRFDDTKAREELGHSSRPAREALTRAVEWFTRDVG
ncbi:MAG: hopanoid-associated sugar epimerase [Acidobacteriota bacterium]